MCVSNEIRAGRISKICPKRKRNEEKDEDENDRATKKRIDLFLNYNRLGDKIQIAHNVSAYLMFAVA
jgi:hypothetical protein